MVSLGTSVLDAEFVAMKIRGYTLNAIQYKLRMVGIPISGPTYIYGNNRLVIHNTLKPELTLKKKYNAIAYHAIHKYVAISESLTRHIRSEDNPARLLTKMITGQ